MLFAFIIEKEKHLKHWEGNIIQNIRKKVLYEDDEAEHCNIYYIILKWTEGKIYIWWTSQLRLPKSLENWSQWIDPALLRSQRRKTRRERPPLLFLSWLCWRWGWRRDSLYSELEHKWEARRCWTEILSSTIEENDIDHSSDQTNLILVIVTGEETASFPLNVCLFQ